MYSAPIVISCHCHRCSIAVSVLLYYPSQVCGEWNQVQLESVDLPLCSPISSISRPCLFLTPVYGTLYDRIECNVSKFLQQIVQKQQTFHQLCDWHKRVSHASVSLEEHHNSSRDISKYTWIGYYIGPDHLAQIAFSEHVSVRSLLASEDTHSNLTEKRCHH